MYRQQVTSLSSTNQELLDQGRNINIISDRSKTLWLCKDAKRKMTYDWSPGGSQDVTIITTSISTCINLYQQSMQKKNGNNIALDYCHGQFWNLSWYPPGSAPWLEHLAVPLKIPTKSPPFLGELDPGSWKPHLRFPHWLGNAGCLKKSIQVLFQVAEPSDCSVSLSCFSSTSWGSCFHLMQLMKCVILLHKVLLFEVSRLRAKFQNASKC